MIVQGDGLKQEEAAANAVKIATDDAEVELMPLETEGLARRIAELAEQAKATDIAALRVLELVQYTDYFVVMSGRSDRHVKAIREHVQDALRDEGRKPLSVEGTEHNQWVLIDYGNVVVHIFYEPVRDFYELERLWGDAPRLDVATSEG